MSLQILFFFFGFSRFYAQKAGEVEKDFKMIAFSGNNSKEEENSIFYFSFSPVVKIPCLT